MKDKIEPYRKGGEERVRGAFASSLFNFWQRACDLSVTVLTWTRRLPDDYAASPASHSRHIFSDVSVDRTVYRTGDSSSARTAIFTSSFWATYLVCGTWTKRRKKSATLRRRSLGTSDVGISRNAHTVVPGVDGFKRLRLTPKLFDWFLDASRFFSDGGGGAIVFFWRRLRRV